MSLPATEQSATITIEGMNCGHCVAKVTSALQSVPGVSQAEVDLAGKRATVRYDTTQASMAKLMGAVNTTGFRAVGFTRTG